MCISTWYVALCWTRWCNCAVGGIWLPATILKKGMKSTTSAAPLPAHFQILPCTKPVSSRNQLLVLLSHLRFPSDSQHSLQKRLTNSKSKSDVTSCMWLGPVGQVLGPCMRFGSLAGSDASASMVKRRQSWLSSTKVKNSHLAFACMQSDFGQALKQVAWQ